MNSLRSSVSARFLPSYLNNCRRPCRGSLVVHQQQHAALQHGSFQGGGRRCYSIATKDMREADFRKVKVNQSRLMESLHDTCQWGTGERWGSAPTETGMARLALSDADKQARDWFVETTEALGCKTTVDAMGNIFAVRPGKNTDAPPTYAGSHLDTQPTGGRYDGILGVHAGVEMLRVIQELGIQTEFPVGVVNWTK